jgi:hypothetical protein
MTTTAAKFWFAVAGLAFVGGILYAAAGGGEWYGSAVLGSLVVASGLLGVLGVAVRDGDVDVTADEVVRVRHALPAGWPALGAVGAGVAVVGLAGHDALLWVGVGVLGQRQQHP